MPSAPLTGDHRFVKSINRMALLRLLRDEPGISRAGLAERSGLTKSTVSLLTKELIDEGWLAEDAAAVTGALGRRPVPLRIVPPISLRIDDHGRAVHPIRLPARSGIGQKPGRVIQLKAIGISGTTRSVDTVEKAAFRPEELNRPNRL